MSAVQTLANLLAQQKAFAKQDTEAQKLQRGVVQDGMVTTGAKSYSYHTAIDMDVQPGQTVFFQKLEGKNKAIIVGA